MWRQFISLWKHVLQWMNFDDNDTNMFLELQTLYRVVSPQCDQVHEVEESWAELLNINNMDFQKSIGTTFIKICLEFYTGLAGG